MGVGEQKEGDVLCILKGSVRTCLIMLNSYHVLAFKNADVWQNVATSASSDVLYDLIPVSKWILAYIFKQAQAKHRLKFLFVRSIKGFLV